MSLTISEKIKNNNQDVSNQSPVSKQSCEDIVNLSVYFDGTGNNLKNDETDKKWANPARLWKNALSYSAFENETNQLVVPLSHPVYVSGVGTPFNGEMDHLEASVRLMQDNDLTGGSTGIGGSKRLQYGAEQINTHLSKVLKQKIEKLEAELQQDVAQRKNEVNTKVISNLNQHRLIKKINLSVFGFSRGAALARVFTNEMIWKAEAENLELKYEMEGYAEKIPMEVKFLGLFDTVASFGLPATNLPNKLTFSGRDMVVDPRVKNCLHLIAGNEQRFAFPVDLVRKDGVLANPKNWKEVVYPGMHSDVGGGYETNSQHVSNNFARITLRHMLDTAEQAGVKLFNYEKTAVEATELFNQQFKIEAETQACWDALQKEAGASTGKVEDDMKRYMQIYYSAYGTLHRQKQALHAAGNSDANIAQSVAQKNRAESRRWWGPADMATEVERVKKARGYTSADSNQVTGYKQLYRVFYPLQKLYEFYIGIDDWELESFEKEAKENTIKFYSNYVHDSKYGFIYNAEPFSYFRQRTVYEPKRSWKGKRVDKKLGPVHEQIARENAMSEAVNQSEAVPETALN
ncbi:DUF2235 domain-containing protein [Acinetobacter cumulans]|uniref:DUF2235 domain-containing protein n=1 Tax=Acinetobacter cumulans TaxID=2136182 RepID=A0ABX9U406_9GAMM|nr:DUF2235 domain-containing protein [Acinetobacter cumulans]RLL40426.1 DUF2235 domain-containing protein [Acinetobacter cumulans]